MRIAKGKALRLAITLLDEQNAPLAYAALQAEALVRAEIKGHSSRPLGAATCHYGALADGFDVASRLWDEPNALTLSGQTLVKGHG